MNNEQGQSLIELVVTVGIFIVIVSASALLIFNSYDAGRLSSEITQANFLAEEGLEAARSIRDNSWDALAPGNHGLDNSTGNWQFSGQSDLIDGKFTQIITVEEIGLDRKKVISQIAWQFTEGRLQDIRLVTYLTNWAKPMPPHLTQHHYRWRNDDGGE